MATAQQYCLRWNNHRSNLLTVFDELLHNEAFTDVTLVCEGGAPIKCHRMVLAACSPYFQNLFTDLPCKHPVVVLKDVKYSEMQAILEYMYRGEVNVAQDQLAALLKVAEALKVKGLVEENRAGKPPKEEERAPNAEHSPSITTSNAVMQNSNVHSSSNSSPPHSTNAMYKNPYNMYSNKPQEHNSRMNLPMWAVPGLSLPPHSTSVPNTAHPHAAATAAAAMLSSCYDTSSEMSPLKRKKLSSLLMNRDTPILRTVLGQGQGQGQADSSQPVSLVCHPDSAENSNGNDERIKHMKNEPSEDAQSPYTDFSPMNDEEDKLKLAIPSSSPHSFTNDMRGVSSRIATYVPTQKPDWKRYKQYTRNEIMSAIEAVRNGMSALQAAKKYGVPSRTLYDKVKKLGITTSRPFKRGSNGSSSCFPYGSGSSYGGHLSESDDGSINNNSALIEASTFLQQAFDSRGGDEREALAAMAAAAAAHAVASGHSTSPNNHSRARSPSPSPTMVKYIRHMNMSSPIPDNDYNNSHSETNGSTERDRDDEDQVEDLSIGRKDHIESRVIMPPMNQVSAIMKKEELLIANIKDEARREPIKKEPSEDAQSLYTDFSSVNDEEDKSRLNIPPSSPQPFPHEVRGVPSGIATYVPAQKPEWKRYKQYTVKEIMSAIEDVRNGMSALQAARKYKVPSRTLYDKVKKLGITTNRPFKRGPNGTSACFPYGSSSPYRGHLSESDDGHINNNSAIVEASTFLQHAFDSRCGDERDTLSAMAAAATAHVLPSEQSSSPNHYGPARSCSPSPSMSNYIRRSSMTPSPISGNEHHSETNGSSEREHDDDDRVEDLSMGRKIFTESRVIIPTINQVTAIMKKEEMLIDSIKEEARRAVSVDCEPQ